MARTGKAFAPQSFAHLNAHSRAISAFVAIARGTYDRPNKLTLPILAGVSVVSILLAANLFIALPQRLTAVVVFMVIGLALTPVWSRLSWKLGSSARFWASAEERSRMIRRDVFARLDRDRAAIGLDYALEPGTLADLEGHARVWEWIDHTLSGAAWKSQPSLRSKVEKAAFDAMSDIVVMYVGSQVAESISGDVTSNQLATQADRLRQLANELPVATRVLESYYRPEETGAGAPVEGSFAELARLEQLLAGA